MALGVESYSRKVPTLEVYMLWITRIVQKENIPRTSLGHFDNGRL